MRACNLWIPVSKLGFQCRTGNNIKMHATLSLLLEPRNSFSIRLNFRIFNDTHTKTICHAPPPPLLRTCTLCLTRNHLMHTWQPVCGSGNYGNHREIYKKYGNHREIYKFIYSEMHVPLYIQW